MNTLKNMSKLSKRKSIVLVGNRIDTTYERLKKITLTAKEVAEKSKDLPHLKNKPIKYLLK